MGTSKNPYPWKQAVRLSLSKPCCCRVLDANRFRQAQSDRVFRGALMNCIIHVCPIQSFTHRQLSCEYSTYPSPIATPESLKAMI